MASKVRFESVAKLAILNVVKYGDTDIFPFPFETHAFFDKQAELLALIVDYEKQFGQNLSSHPPRHESSLVPAGYSGFRWATQLDPIWNIHFLACVLAVANDIENIRVPADESVVFSYRYAPDKKLGSLFNRDIGWFQFMQRSIALTNEYEHVVVCDISEFYPRLSHHRLENSLSHAAPKSHYPSTILSFLSQFSNTNSFGLPIGGPSARILSECAINQVDWLLLGQSIKFVRFADDYHIFTKTKEDAYRALIFLSDKLYTNQGLTLQKSKTRIVTAAEFRSTAPINADDESTAETEGAEAGRAHESNQLLRFSLRFDPYSPTADKDYDELIREVKKFDILGLLKRELTKTRVHVALTRKIVSALRYLEGSTRDDAILSIIDNSEVLFPIFSSVMLTVSQVFGELSGDAQAKIVQSLRELIRCDSHIFRVDIHLMFALRVLANVPSPENSALLQQLYVDRTSALVRRDIILIMARWNEWYWLSDLRSRFRTLSGPERRAFIAASYTLREEGQHWRQHTKSEFDPHEEFINQWASERAQVEGWSVPL